MFCSGLVSILHLIHFFGPLSLQVQHIPLVFYQVNQFKPNWYIHLYMVLFKVFYIHHALYPIQQYLYKKLQVVLKIVRNWEYCFLDFQFFNLVFQGKIEVKRFETKLFVETLLNMGHLFLGWNLTYRLKLTNLFGKLQYLKKPSVVSQSAYHSGSQLNRNNFPSATLAFSGFFNVSFSSGKGCLHLRFNYDWPICLRRYVAFERAKLSIFNTFFSISTFLGAIFKTCTIFCVFFLLKSFQNHHKIMPVELSVRFWSIVPYIFIF